MRLFKPVVADPDRPISGIDILTPAERHQFLVAYNDTTAPMAHRHLPVLFEIQARATPQALAVVFEDTTLTYSQLNAQANQLARALIQLVVRVLSRSSRWPYPAHPS